MQRVFEKFLLSTLLLAAAALPARAQQSPPPRSDSAKPNTDVLDNPPPVTRVPPPRIVPGQTFSPARMALMPAPSKALSPIFCDTLDAALESAGRRDLVVLLGVGLGADGDIPPLFREAPVARASRMIVSLASVDYFPDQEFFKSRNFPADKAPGIALLDAYGNILDLQPEKVDPAALVAAARNARKVALELREELAKAAPLAEKLGESKEEGPLLEFLRPWLSRHLRGYPETARFIELVAPRGNARIRECLAGPATEAAARLEAIAREYAHSPVEASALVELARLHEKDGRRDPARRLLLKVVNELPWPENAAAHRDAKALLAAFRKDDIRRRLDEMEKKKREQAEKK